MIPAGRKRLLLHFRFQSGLVLLGLASGTLSTALIFADVDLPPPLPLMLEFDYVENTEAIQDRPDACLCEKGHLNPWTLKKTYEEAGVDLTIDDSQKIPWGEVPPGSDYCMTIESIDNLVLKTRGVFPGWHAHGLGLPGFGVYKAGALTDPMYCTKYLGLLWLMPSGRIGIRQDFVTFWKALESEPGIPRCKAFTTNVHELAHVLNLHHAEIRAQEEGVDVCGEFLLDNRGTCHDHLMNHRPPRYPLTHIEPGPTGDLWCPLKYHSAQCSHQRVSTGCACTPCRTLPDTQPVLEPPPAPLPQITSHDSVRLTVDPDKGEYFRGEPIHVKVQLEGGGVDVRPGGVLDWEHGDVKFFVGESKDSVETPLPLPFLFEPTSPGPAVSSPLKPVMAGIWFTLPKKFITTRSSFYVRATFTGFTDFRRGIFSAPKEIKIRTGDGLWNGKAFRRFIKPQARRMVFFLGGRHLTDGVEYLATIARDYGGTIYAPYANLALGMMWLRSFHDLNRAGALVVKPAEPEKARPHLRAAREKQIHLSEFYKDVLCKALISIDERCDAPAEPVRAAPVGAM